MNPWKAQRSSREAPGFAASVERSGLDQARIDKIMPSIEYVLCGVDAELLEREYPPEPTGGFRILLTDPAFDVPALRLAFSLVTDGAIYYHAVAMRETD